MKNSKAILAWILTLAMAASMTGCGSTKDETNKAEKPKIETKTETAPETREEAAETTAAAAKDDGAAMAAGAADDADTGDTGEFYDGGDMMFEAAEAGGGAAFAARSDAAAKSDTAGAFKTAGAAEAVADDTEEIPPDIIDIEPPEPYDPGEAFVLTAGEWNDNDNWGFFRNLVDNGTISFPAYGVDPRNRIEVNVVDNSDAPAPNETVELKDKDGKVLWTSKTDKNGKAYVFYTDGSSPYEISAGGINAPAVGEGEAAPDDDTDDPQARHTGSGAPVESTTVKLDGSANDKYSKTEVMFILDTTGSMGDEIAYLQKDFSSIAEEVAGDNVTFSMNFYRDEGDEYVTKCNPFTADVKELQKQLNAERADGGGDWEEAVADVLRDTMIDGSWSGDSNKIAFLIFDAPPHPGTEDTVVDAVKAASEKGVHLVPVIASNSGRETELFGRAVSICTNSNYVFITDDSGVGDSHLEPIIGDYDVELLHDIIVRNINEIK